MADHEPNLFLITSCHTHRSISYTQAFSTIRISEELEHLSSSRPLLSAYPTLLPIHLFPRQLATERQTFTKMESRPSIRHAPSRSASSRVAVPSARSPAYWRAMMNEDASVRQQQEQTPSPPPPQGCLPQYPPQQELLQQHLQRQQQMQQAPVSPMHRMSLARSNDEDEQLETLHYPSSARISVSNNRSSTGHKVSRHLALARPTKKGLPTRLPPSAQRQLKLSDRT